MKKTNNRPLYKAHSIGYLVLAFCLCIPFCSCNKYLDAKPDQSITTPSTIEDLEGILNNYAFINARYPSASEISSDDFYLTSADWGSLIEQERNFYTWQKYDNIGGNYTAPYSSIAYVNIILDALPAISNTDLQRKNNIRGSALFIRASYHFALSQLFSKAYDQTTAQTDLGIVLRTTSDIAIKEKRSTVSETYNSVISDIKAAIPLLSSSSDIKYRPSRPAAYGLLARVYLSMSDYANAGLYADSCLQLYGKLIDYNTINPTTTIPFKQFNDEVIYDARTYSPPQSLGQSKAKVDTLLYASFVADDLRKTVLFKSNTNGSIAFKGNYTGLNNASLFTGIATDEIYLIEAEAAVRSGHIAGALQNLNSLLLMRWKKGTFIPYLTTDSKQLLNIILQERRKELLFRTLRWTDLRRLNREPDHSKTIYRNLNGMQYSLEPTSLRYVFEIDQNAVNLGGLEQNP